jgi:hypothetical protein
MDRDPLETMNDCMVMKSHAPFALAAGKRKDSRKAVYGKKARMP